MLVEDRGKADASGDRELSALLLNLRLLDERLEVAIARLRDQIPPDADPAHRGLIIDESDVDGWLSSLGGSVPHAPVQQMGPLTQNPGRLKTLAQLFNLNDFEVACLLTMLAPEVDLAYASLYAYVQDDVTRKYATLDLAVTLWCGSVEERLQARLSFGSGATLRKHLLAAVDESPYSHLPLLARATHLDARISSYLLGSDDPEGDLLGAVKVTYPTSDKSAKNSAISEGQMRSLEGLARRSLSGPATGATAGEAGSLVVWLRGPERRAKRLSAEDLASRLECPLVTVDMAALVGASGDLRKLFYRALREARLQGGIILWEGADLIASRREEVGVDVAANLIRALDSWRGCALFDVRGALPLHLPPSTLSIELNFPTPSNETRRQLWEHALNSGTPLAPDVDLGFLTGAFRLTGEQIDAAADSARHAALWRTAASQDPNDNLITMRDLMLASRSHSNQGLGLLARKITARYTWNDLVLPAERLSQLHEMSDHVRYGQLVFETWGFDRKLAGGKGLNVLFAGQPGTGKTMAAEVLATDLGLELYKIDLSSVVSKYIGETEKNLEKIFSEGQTSNAILFFDEADSLFGKRSSVKDSHDRYANIEISYLLQRMEEYDGIVILATNLRKNLDDAFVRRLHGAIEFPMPEEPDRLEIWQRTFPVEAPLSPEADLGFLAKRFKLSGGNIKNIVLESAFFAAQAGTDINMQHLVKATRREHQKIGKLIQSSDFGPYSYLVTGEIEEDEVQ